MMREEAVEPEAAEGGAEGEGAAAAHAKEAPAAPGHGAVPELPPEIPVRLRDELARSFGGGRKRWRAAAGVEVARAPTSQAMYARVRRSEEDAEMDDVRGELEFNFSSNSFRELSKPRLLSNGSAGTAGEGPHAERLGPRRASLYSSWTTLEMSEEIGEEGPCCEACCASCVWTPEQHVLHRIPSASTIDSRGIRALEAAGDTGGEDEDGEEITTGVLVRRTIVSRLRMLWIHVILESSWFCLSLLGIACSVLAWCIDELVAVLVTGKASVANLAQSSVTSYILWTFFTTTLAVGSVVLTERISPLAGGSGIPQMKSILAGFHIKGYLSLRTLLSKVIGLLLALSSGMVIGKEGPFVHVSCILANQMLRIPIFAEIRTSPALKKQVLAAACAVGVSSTFGAPIGGVLFSIEVTSSLYQTSEYWKSFFCVVCGAFVFRELSNFGQSRNNVVSLFTTNFEPLPYQVIELPLFVLLSVICGYLGGCFVLLHSKIAEQRQSGPVYITNTYSFAVIVSVITSAALFPLGDFMQFSLHNAIDDLLVNDEIHNAAHSRFWDEPSRFINLVLFAWIKLLLSALAINLPIPCGVFTPVFAGGAAIGRLFGEIIHALGAEDLTPGGYALVGAASFTAGATGTVSTAVIVFELTNQLSYMLPVLLSVLVGQAAARQISLSIYESLARAKNLPTFPHVRKQSSYSLPVHFVMNKCAPGIPRFVSKEGVEEALLRADNVSLDPLYLFAIVDTLENRYYLGSVTWRALHRLLQSHKLWRRAAGADPPGLIDLFKHVEVDASTLAVTYLTPLNDAINYFDVHKRKSFFVVRRGAVVGKLYLREIARQCDQGNL